MRVKSILYQVEKYKDFVYERVRSRGEDEIGCWWWRYDRERALQVGLGVWGARPGV